MSKVEITATNAAGEVLIGSGEVTWAAATAQHNGSLKPSAVHSWTIYEDDGSMIGWMPVHSLKPGDDDDETEAEG